MARTAGIRDVQRCRAGERWHWDQVSFELLWPDMAALASYSFFLNDTATTGIYTLSLHDALPILSRPAVPPCPTICRARRSLTHRSQSFVPTARVRCMGSAKKSLSNLNTCRA